MTGRTLEEMKLDIIRWKLEAAERRAEEEFDELCHERPKEYGVKPAASGWPLTRALFTGYCTRILSGAYLSRAFPVSKGYGSSKRLTRKGTR